MVGFWLIWPLTELVEGREKQYRFDKGGERLLQQGSRLFKVEDDTRDYGNGLA